MDLITPFTLIAVVLGISALASRLVERSILSFPFIFIALGFVLGESVTGLVEIHPEDESLEIVATITLALVLFLDAVRFQFDGLGKRWLIPFLILGPGTIAIIAAGAGLIVLFLGFGFYIALIGGAVLASTDPVILRDIIREERIPRSIRQILKIEAGLNDLVVLPAIVVLIALAGSEGRSAADWTRFGVELIIVGPAIGFAIGGGGSWLVGKVDAAIGIRREHQALFGIALVLGAYAAATAAGGDGFLAAFFAGLAVVVLNTSLCDCFLDYGETTAEMAMLLAFILFGSVLSGIIGEVDLLPALALGATLIFVVRPVVITAVLSRVRASRDARALIAWFGPRGLNSLLLALLAVHAGLADATLLLGAVAVVVVLSAALHGASTTPLANWYERRLLRATHEEEREATAGELFSDHPEDVPRITPLALNDLLNGADPPLVLDVRTRSAYEHDGAKIPGSVRVVPDAINEWAQTMPRERRIIAYCT